MHAEHVLFIRTLLRALKAGIKNTNPLIKNLSRLLRKNPVCFMWVSTVLQDKVMTQDIGVIMIVK